MSEYLNKIHYIMYNKVVKFDDFSNKIIEKMGKIDKIFPIIEKKDLKDIIDHNNIHMWLANKIDLVEDKFAYTVSYCLKNNILTKDQLRKISFDLGKENKIDVCGTFEFFNELNSILLDGMPCDRAVNVSTDGQNIFVKVVKDTHSKYFKYFDIDSKIFYELRDAYLLGILEDTKYKIKGSSIDNYTLFV